MKLMNRRLVDRARKINFIWSAVAPLILRRRTGAMPGPPSSILVFDLHLIGDLVILLPFLASLRKTYPAARITLIAGPWAASLLMQEGLVDEHISFVAPWVKRQSFVSGVRHTVALVRRLRRNEWDWAIDIRGDIRQILLVALSGAHRRVGYAFTGGEALLTDVVKDDGKLRHLADHNQRIAEHLGTWQLVQDPLPRISLSSEEIGQASQIEPFVGFHFGASMPLRRLPPIEGARLINSFAEANERLVLFEPPEMESYNAALKSHLREAVRDRLETWSGTLRAFVVVVSRAKQFFAMDSGPAHVAAALGVPTVVFYGPSHPEYTRPYGTRVSIIESTNLYCRPCDHLHCTNSVHQACMSSLVDMYLRQREIDAPASTGAISVLS